jgi:hypothetical protein
MSENESDPTIVDFLTGRTSHEPLMKITPHQRQYYNYRHGGKVSFEAETASVGASLKSRDFRSERELEQDLKKG